MSDIVLATLNARYSHASLALRYLHANLRPELFARASIREFTIKDAPVTVAQKLLAMSPRVVGLGVYIWNVTATAEVVRALKARRPDVVVVLGGPEVSHETSGQPIVAAADYVICGEGDVSFDRLCGELLLAAERPRQKIIPGVLADIETLRSPYRLYTDEDCRQRVIYVEASRGCPFKCEFCLSSLDRSVRDFPLDPLLAELELLLRRGVRQFKFIDRTFNLKIQTSSAILQFFLDRYVPGLFLHFELIPDRLPEQLRSLIARFPRGSLQFEVGIQSFNEEVNRRITRKQDNSKVEDNFRFLKEHTGVHVHADLIVGLPGEDLESFARGFDRLYALGAAEIQVGMLKRLRGTPITRHTTEWGMVYDADPPYEVRATSVLDPGSVQRLRRFAKFWDLVHNSGNFRGTARAIESRGKSPFAAFMELSDWLHDRLGRTHSIALELLAEQLAAFLAHVGWDEKTAAELVVTDYVRSASRPVPVALRPYVDHRNGMPVDRAGIPKRQARHLA